MLLFCSVEHVQSWWRSWKKARGESFSLEQGWGLAEKWYGWDRREVGWRRWTDAEARIIFHELGLRSPFWEVERVPQ